MSSSRKPAIIHPFIYFVIEDGFSAIFDHLKARGGLGDALRDLYWLTVFLDEEGQEELKPIIDQMEHLQDNIPKLSRASFRDVMKKVSIYLHKQGYFITAKAEIPTRKVSFKTLEEQLGGASEGNTE